MVVEAFGRENRFVIEICGFAQDVMIVGCFAGLPDFFQMTPF